MTVSDHLDRVSPSQVIKQRQHFIVKANQDAGMLNFQFIGINQGFANREHCAYDKSDKFSDHHPRKSIFVQSVFIHIMILESTSG